MAPGSRTWGSWRYWLVPGMGVKRHVTWAVLGASVAIVGTIGFTLWLLGDRRDALAAPIEDLLVGAGWTRAGGWVTGALVALGVTFTVAAIARLNRSLLSNWLVRPQDAAQLVHRRLTLARGPKIVAIGGGTGLSLLLRGLREHSSNLTAVVAVSDDGGSSGRLRAAFGMPAPGDLSDCLAALSVDEASLGRLLQYRFTRGEALEGHTFGNLLITTLSEVEGDFGDALRVMQRLLNLNGAVWPATAQAVTLRVVKADGSVVEGESNLAAHPGPAARVTLNPDAPEALPEVVAALADADLVVLGPGSVFTSTLPPVVVPAVAAALRDSPATLVQVINIMTEAGETDGFDAWDHVDAIERHVGRRPDLVVVNDTPLDAERVAAYRAEGAEVVAVDPDRFRAADMAFVAWPLLGPAPHAQHDPAALARGLVTWWAERGGR
ncbi:MAG: uridine diphosphate-N-acetylglucosamine-binding protein YvcK [Trueperaceae bacterium]|nr:uridine diphosphate-N-acetylglucosamine-binding protein YvcK [Trueperaceae bacterium]